MAIRRRLCVMYGTRSSYDDVEKQFIFPVFLENYIVLGVAMSIWHYVA